MSLSKGSLGLNVSKPRRHTTTSKILLGEFGVIVVILAIAAASEAQTMPAVPPRTSTVAGKSTFTAQCASCHGLDGRGGERAPNIATKNDSRSMSDEQLRRTIREGIPDFGMPGFRSLGEPDIAEVVGYLRMLQGRSSREKPPGDPQSGKAIFFGKGKCSGCHIMSGEGSFLGPDLTTYGHWLSVKEIREAITEPKPPSGHWKTAVATARDGRRIAGVVRNEDNFSIQFQAADGTLHFFSKEELKRLEYGDVPAMPADYGQKLSAKELDDVVSYLYSSGAEAGETTGGEDPR